jgi:cation:H+ antiporter
MHIFLVILLFAVGIILIVKGGDYFVDAASWMAEVSGIPKLIVGATVVSFATTLPELLVSAFAAAQGKVDMSIGNAVGSVTANLGLIMAIALICMPTVIKRRDYMLKSCLMLGAALFLVVFGAGGELALIPSILLLAIFIIAMAENIHEARLGMREEEREEEAGLKQKPAAKEIALNIVKFIAGTVGIVLGAQLLIDNGSELARFIGVPERIIGVTIIAIGTSLPELVTTITAIAKKQASLSVGNIIGANIIDLTLILPISAMIYGGGLPPGCHDGSSSLPAGGLHCCDPGFDLQKIPPLAGHCAFVYICRLCCAHLFWFALRPRQVCSAVRRVKKQTLSNEKLSRPFYLEWPAVFFPLVFYTYDFLTRFENVTVVRQNIHILQCGASALHHTVERVICHAGADPRALLHHCIHSVEQRSTAG